jgi:hypothetical protein
VLDPKARPADTTTREHHTGHSQKSVQVKEKSTLQFKNPYRTSLNNEGSNSAAQQGKRIDGCNGGGERKRRRWMRLIEAAPTQPDPRRKWARTPNYWYPLSDPQAVAIIIHLRITPKTTTWARYHSSSAADAHLRPILS